LWVALARDQFFANPFCSNFVRRGARSEPFFCKSVLLGTGLRFLSSALGANQSGPLSCKPLRFRLCLKGCFVGAPILRNGFVTNRCASSRLRFVGCISSGSVFCNPLLLQLCPGGARSEPLFCKPVLLGTGLRFLSFALGANQSGPLSCKPLRFRLCLKWCFVGTPISQNGFVTNRFAIPRLRHGPGAVASSFLQAASAQTVSKRLFGRSNYFASRPFGENNCDFSRRLVDFDYSLSLVRTCLLGSREG